MTNAAHSTSQLILDPVSQLVTTTDATPTISVIWDRAVQKAVITAAVGPTVASRAYGILHTAMFDAWAAYDTNAVGTQLGDDLQRSPAENTTENKAEAMSFAAYRILTELFSEQADLFSSVMAELGYDTANTTTNTTAAAGIGNVSAEALMAYRRNDGANQANGYESTIDYTPVNTSSSVQDLEKWTAERVPIDSTDGPLQSFLTPHWGTVETFGLEDSDAARPVAPQPFLLVENATTDLVAGTITLASGTVLQISTALIGTIINPAFIAQAEQVVEYSANLTDKEKLIAEFWEDGGGTSFPPGTWMSFGQYVSSRDDHTLDEDAKMFFALGNAALDAGIATWEAKTYYDYARPVRTIRELGRLGLIGEYNDELGGYTIEAWAGPGKGTKTILATDFLTYQTPGSDPSPPFSEYTSGHSSFSAAGAVVLELFSGSDAFGGEVTFRPGESRFEYLVTPTEEVTLSWDSFSDAADEAGASRVYGGIHFNEGDINGRTLGNTVGTEAFIKAQSFIQGAQASPVVVGTSDGDIIRAKGNNGTLAGGTFYGRAGNDLIVGSKGKDTIFGGDGDDVLKGDKGALSEGNDDIIYGNAGRDRIVGKAGNDTLYGGDDDDRLIGDSGDDVLSGGLGNDKLTGDRRGTGGGADTFILRAFEGLDIITDFEVGIDKIGLGGGLSFSDLSFEKRQILTNGAAIATLRGIETTTLTADSFISI
ncbi:MAG: DUF6851 domain-containing protein [Cyanobacteria bacterium P01_D01_bin.36]